ncbi:hypothetical protein [Ferrovum myxofaciens]|uniref:Uncharacterized protein n=1 Tax=Ferrovum myxofaciens TaxID=416213 RepID=A0A9E6MWX5_9PROT|nr:hypothetical protein [Ferrovum myxofaciens]QWY77848.1 MAG: hypothetical protein JZL65_01800 [Ferrovum myxofaciens]
MQFIRKRLWQQEASQYGYFGIKPKRRKYRNFKRVVCKRGLAAGHGLDAVVARREPGVPDGFALRTLVSDSRRKNTPFNKNGVQLLSSDFLGTIADEKAVSGEK